MIVTDVGQGMRWTRRCRARASAQTNGTRADGEVVWFRRPDAGVKFCGLACEATVATKPVTEESAK